MVPVPLLLSANVTPVGRLYGLLGLRLICGFGKPFVVKVKLHATPTPQLVWSTLVTDAASLSVSVNDCVASGLMLFVALSVNVYGPPLDPVPSPEMVAVPPTPGVKLIPAGSELPGFSE